MAGERCSRPPAVPGGAIPAGPRSARFPARCACGWWSWSFSCGLGDGRHRVQLVGSQVAIPVDLDAVRAQVIDRVLKSEPQVELLLGQYDGGPDSLLLAVVHLTSRSRDRKSVVYGK